VPTTSAENERPSGKAAWAERSAVGTAWNCVLVSAVYHGAALAARDWLVRYLHERVPSNLGAPLASLPRFQNTVGEIEALLHTSDRLLGAVASEAEHADDDAPASLAQSATLAKLTATNNAIRAVELGLALTGNPGLSRRNPLERHYRDVLCSRIHTPQDDTILAAAGRSALDAAIHPHA